MSTEAADAEFGEPELGVDAKSRWVSRNIASFRSSLLRHLGLLVVIVALGTYTAIRSDAFMTSDNMFNLLRQTSVVAVLAAGATVLLISGGIDFSIAGIAAVSASVAALLARDGQPTWLIIVLSLAAGLGLGMINGSIVAFSKAAPFVVTLGTATFLGGLTLLIIDGRTVSMNSRIQWLGRGELFGAPTPVVVAGAVLLATGLMLRHSVFGRRAFSIGGNEQASLLAGIPVRRSKILFYAFSGFLAGLAGLMLAARVGAVSPGTGGGLELQAYAAVVIGGTSIFGGRGTMIGTTLGVLVLGLSTNSLNLTQVSTYYQAMVVGGIIVVAVILNSFRERRS